MILHHSKLTSGMCPLSRPLMSSNMQYHPNRTVLSDLVLNKIIIVIANVGWQSYAVVLSFISCFITFYCLDP